MFEWDPRNARANYGKHSISVVEAVSVFSNPPARIFPDEEHPAEKSREIVIGHSAARRLLLVCFMEQETGRRTSCRVPFRLHDCQAESIRQARPAGIGRDTFGPRCGAGIQERRVGKYRSAGASGDDAEATRADERVIQTDHPGANTDSTRHSLRQLGRNPWCAVVAVLTRAFGIGANTAIFSVAPAVQAPLPVHRD